MLYFCDGRLSPKTKSSDQYRRLLEFREACSRQGLVQHYKNSEQFRKLLTIHITRLVNDQPNYFRHGIIEI